MGFSNNYFERLIVPKTEEDKAAATALKNAIDLYREMPFTTSEIYLHIRDSVNVSARNVSDAVLRLAKAGILVAESDGTDDNKYTPVEEFDMDESYMSILLEHAKNSRKCISVSTSEKSAPKIITPQDTTTYNTEFEQKYHDTIRRLKQDLETFLEKIPQDFAETGIGSLYKHVVAEVSPDGGYAIGILNDVSGNPSLGPINPNGRKKEFLKGTLGGGEVSLCETHSRTNEVLCLPLNRDELIFALRCAGIDSDAAEKYLPKRECFAANVGK